jgi:hypothetical protein
MLGADAGKSRASNHKQTRGAEAEGAQVPPGVGTELQRHGGLPVDLPGRELQHGAVKWLEDAVPGKKKIGTEVLLEAFGLGVDRLFHEVNQRLEAHKLEFYEGRPITNPKDGSLLKITDNGTRMRATELLADLHGVRKQSLDLNLGAGDGNELILKLNRPQSDPEPESDQDGD